MEFFRAIFMLFLASMPAVSLATDAVRTPISSLPFTIDQPGHYYVTEGLDGGGIEIVADNVTLDLSDNTLTGNGAANYGIHIAGSKEITIKNGIIQGYGWAGIYAGGGSTDSIVVENIRAIDNGSLGNDDREHGGISLWAGTGHRVQECVARGNGGTGIVVGGSSHVIKSTVANNGRNGVTTLTSAYVEGNMVLGNQWDGIFVRRASTVVGNVLRANLTGIIGWEGLVVKDNASYFNTVGFDIGASSTVENNTSTQNKDLGMRVGKNSTVVGNTIDENGGVGLRGGDGSLFKGNTVTNNVGHGIFVEGEHAALRENHVAGVKIDHSKISSCIHFVSDDNVAIANTATGCINLFTGAVPPAGRFIDNIGWW